MTAKRRILVVDDQPRNARLLEAMLVPRGYAVVAATSGQEALAKVASERPDLVLLDIVMPGMNGYEVCQLLRADPATRFLPIVMVTSSPGEDKVRAIEVGADDFLPKPIDQYELLARVRSLLRLKDYHDTIERQAAELAEWNRTLESRVHGQVEELVRLRRLSRFLSPQVAEVILSQGDEAFLQGHRREITAVFCDLRGFTSFSETAEPEEAFAILREYHGAVGELVFHFDGTLEHFAGDGMMVFFNDPVPVADPQFRAVRMALAMRERVNGELAAAWRKRGYELGLGIGIATGYATLGRIGFEGRFDYGAIGAVTNLASRLAAEARGGQILLSPRAYAPIEDLVEVELVGELSLRGLARPISAVNVLQLKEGVPTPSSWP